MNFRKNPNGTITMIQPAVIEKLLNSLWICGEWKMHDAPANVILTKDEDGNGRKQEYHYCSVICQIKYIYGRTKPDIHFYVHQYAKYSIDPKQSHKEGVKSIGLYFKKTKDKVLVFIPDGSNGPEFYAGVYSAGAWYREYADQMG